MLPTVLALLDEVDPKRELVERFELHEATLDDVFFALTSRHGTQTTNERLVTSTAQPAPLLPEAKGTARRSV